VNQKGVDSASAEKRIILLYQKPNDYNFHRSRALIKTGLNQFTGRQCVAGWRAQTISLLSPLVSLPLKHYPTLTHPLHLVPNDTLLFTGMVLFRSVLFTGCMVCVAFCVYRLSVWSHKESPHPYQQDSNQWSASRGPGCVQMALHTLSAQGWVSILVDLFTYYYLLCCVCALDWWLERIVGTPATQVRILSSDRIYTFRCIPSSTKSILWMDMGYIKVIICFVCFSVNI
jgi:hypothetical protein